MEFILRVKFLIYKLKGGKESFRRYSASHLISYMKQNRLDGLVKEELSKKKFVM